MMLIALLVAQAVVPQETGTIVFYRGSTIWGAAGACPIRYEGRELVELGRGRFAEWKVKPGRYTFSNKRSGIEVAVAPGETRYVRCQIRNGMFEGGAELQFSDEASFKRRSGEFERKDITPLDFRP